MICIVDNDYISHHGILGMKWGIRRYQPYSTTGKRKSGKTGKEVGEAAKAQSRKDRAKEIAKKAGQIALKSALVGATVAAKVVFSSAITSATLVGIAAAGYQTITSPEFESLMTNIATKAGTWLVDKYVRQGTRYVDDNLDMALMVGEQYLKTL